MSRLEQAQRRRERAAIAIALLLILVVGAAFRLYNVNWDKDTYHIHPDERYTTMVVTAIEWPSSLAEYLDTSRSPLNPRTHDMVYFYGTFPLFLTKAVATALDAAVDATISARPTIPEWALTLAPFTSYDRIHLVGRVLSALFDLASVLLLFFFARRLFDWRVGLAASFLLALAVLDIQGSHYFAVDTFLTFFVLLTLWTLLDVAEGKGWRAFVGLGISMGLTLACKVSVFLIVLVVVLAAWLLVRRRVAHGRDAGRASLGALGGLLLAAVLALGVFRVAQPYAWAGPNYTGWDKVPQEVAGRLQFLEKIPERLKPLLMPNPKWIADILEANGQQTGAADVPWGHQWAERPAYAWPLYNTVVWGTGVPLGAAACAGVLLALFLFARRRFSHLPLPPGEGRGEGEASPLPHLSSSAAKERGGPRGGEAPPPRLPRPDGGGGRVLIPLAWVVLIFAWQGAQYVKSVRYFLPLYPCLALFAAWLIVRTWDAARRRSRGVRIAAGVLAGTVLLGTFLWALAFIQIYREPITRVQASRWIYANIPQGSTIATEHYDDPLPFNLDGHNAYGGMYTGVELTNYWEDTPDKVEKLLSDLDQADYIVMSSGRLSTSIPRLPMRYPVTTRYYSLLQAGLLGFDKVKEFHSYPRLLGLEFDDTSAEEQFTVYDHPKVQIYEKTAAFSVDTVRAQLIEGIDWDTIAHGLLARDVGKWKREQRRLERLSDAQQGQNDLMLTAEQRRVQEEGGTWASIFRRSSLPNRLPVLAWLVLLAALGLAALPLTVLLFQWLPDRGYILARPAGVLLLAWLSWILTNLTPLHYSRGTILLAFGLIVLASAATLALPGQRQRLRDLWRTQRRMILGTEGLFLAFFLVCLLIRYANPDLWHPWRGGEKPMDFAYLNAVIKSTEFPPYDPWFAGGYLNYYYFGQVMAGTLVKLIGIVPSVAYNLVVPAWFAMTAMGAFCVTYNLVAHPQPASLRLAQGRLPVPMGERQPPPCRTCPRAQRRSGGDRGGVSRPFLVALLGALLVVLLGNLGEIALVVEKVSQGVLEGFKSTVPGLEDLVRFVAGLFQVVFGQKPLSVGLQEWYWNATRSIPPGEAYGITEFPFFTFLLADLHAHLLAMPLTFLSLAAAVAVVRRPAAAALRQERLKVLAGLVALAGFWGLVIGALRTTNAWDVPPQLLVALGALIIGEVSRRRQEWGGAAPARRWLGPAGFVAWQWGLLFLLGWAVLFRPFWAHYGSYYNSVAVWRGPRTPLGAYLVIHSVFLLVIVGYLAARLFSGRSAGRSDPTSRRIGLTLRFRRRAGRLREVARFLGVRGLPVSRWIWAAVALLVILELLFLVPGLVPFTKPQSGTVYGDEETYRGLAVWALGLPVALLGLALLLRPRISPMERLWAYIVLLALAMTMGVEVIVLRGDIERMNTVFKFYLQVWLFWGVAAAVALAWLIPHLRRWGRGRAVWLAVLGLLVAGAALYPALATWAKARDRFDPALGPGLDGWAYMQTARYADNDTEYELKWDYEAMQWLLDNVVGSPVIMEGYATEYRWGARYANNTGLPAVIGWNWHQRQQRAAVGDQQVLERVADVSFFYDTPFADDAQEVLERYGVRYVVVGPMERASYAAASLDKFEEMANDGRLGRVYQNEGVTIYEVRR